MKKRAAKSVSLVPLNVSSSFTPDLIAQRAIALHDSEIRAILKKHFRTMDEISTLHKWLESIDLFSEFKKKIDTENYTHLLRTLKFETAPKDQLLFRAGEKAQKFYIILRGQVSVFLPKTPEDSHACSLSKPDRSEQLALRRALSERRLGGSPLHRRRCTDITLDHTAYNNTELSQSNPFEFKEKLTLKGNRPHVKFAHWVTKFWVSHIKSDKNLNQIFGENSEVHKSVFSKYNVCFYQNVVLRRISLKNGNLITPENLRTLFSKLKLIDTLGKRSCLGEDALQQTAFTRKTIYCSDDCEFATIEKSSKNILEFLINWEQRDQENFLRCFDVFNHWIEKDKLGQIGFCLQKKDHKGIGSYVYRGHELTKGIYLLKSGEIEISYAGKKNMALGNIKNGISRAKLKACGGEDTESSEYKQPIVFKRLLKPMSIFGVEELLANCPVRVFSAQVKTEKCVYFEISREKIFEELLSKCLQFFDILKKYSCLTNEALCHGVPLPELLGQLRESSIVNCRKESTELINGYLSEDKQEDLIVKTWKKYLGEQSFRADDAWCSQDKKFEFLTTKVAGISGQASSVDKKNLLPEPLMRPVEMDGGRKPDKLLDKLMNSNDLQRLSNEHMKWEFMKHYNSSVGAGKHIKYLASNRLRAIPTPKFPEKFYQKSLRTTKAIKKAFDLTTISSTARPKFYQDTPEVS
jgi:CRP-like cAMP-binding protein